MRATEAHPSAFRQVLESACPGPLSVRMSSGRTCDLSAVLPSLRAVLVTAAPGALGVMQLCVFVYLNCEHHSPAFTQIFGRDFRNPHKQFPPPTRLVHHSLELSSVSLLHRNQEPAAV